MFPSIFILEMIMDRMPLKQLHTIISKETNIKPSSPTPLHLNTHTLSFLDRIAPNYHVPFIYFYQNYKKDDIENLKNSLSQSLTHYYTFAGRLHSPFSPHIDCNDEGVVFLEAYNHSRLDDYINLKDDQYETLDQLIPNALGCPSNLSSPNMMEVQLTRFTCGGAALAVSISHKVADALSMTNFMNHWANVARGRSPSVAPFSSYVGDMNILERLAAMVQPKTDNVTYAIRRFVFPDSKLNELKRKINDMATTPINPTRVESLSALIFKCAMDAAATKSSSFQPSCLTTMVNLRNKLPIIFPESTQGNLVMWASSNVTTSSHIKLDYVITSLRKEIMAYQEIKDTEELDKKISNLFSTNVTNPIRYLLVSSLCRVPYYQVDFGWGKPVRVIFKSANSDAELVMLMDDPHSNGIEAIVKLEEEEMAIFQKDKEILAYVENI